MFSSGDQDYSSFLEGNTAGTSGVFIPVSSRETGLVFSPVLTNVLFPEISYSIIPFRNFQMSLKGLFFFSSTLGPLFEDDTQLFPTGRYIGSEVNLSLKYRPFSDLGVGISGGVFFPNGESVEVRGIFELSLSF